MKTRIALILSGFLITPGMAPGQETQPVRTTPARTLVGQQAPVAAPGVVVQRPAPEESLTRFDLDFPGGTPEQLVRAIEKSSGKPLNAIVPIEYADLRLPPLKMRSVTVPALFEALQSASRKTELYASGSYDYGFGTGAGTRTQYSQHASNYGFLTQGRPSDDSVWYFYHNQRPKVEEPKACRFYQLAPYLETYKVEDITTAIQTGWKMLGEASPPTISYHRDTKLLVAVGEQNKLLLIDEVLAQLSATLPRSDGKASQSKVATEKTSKSE